MRIAHSPAETEALLEEFVSTDLPAFAIANSGSTGTEARSRLTPLLPSSLQWQDKQPDEFWSEPGEGLRIHVDNVPVTPDQSAIDVNAHFTKIGTAVASFFRIGPTLRGNLRDRTLLGSPILTPEGYTKLHEGLVDPEYLEPLCWRTTCQPGTTVFFKEGEPLAHAFRTGTTHRYSEAALASLVIHPGLGLRIS